MIIKKCETLEDWKETRRATTGASDAPIVNGDIPNHGLLALWASKVEGFDPFGDEAEDEPANLALGRLFQLPIAQYFAAKDGGEILDVGDRTILVSERWDGASTTLDYLYKHPDRDGLGVLEVKSYDRSWAKEFKHGATPPRFETQVLHQEFVAEAKWGLLVTRLGTGKPFDRFVPFNEAKMSALLEKERAFMALVKARTPPQASACDDDSDYLAEMTGKPNPLDMVDLTADHSLLFEQYKLHSVQTSVAKDLAKAAKNQLLLACRGKGRARLADGRVLKITRVDCDARDQHVDAYSYHLVNLMK